MTAQTEASERVASEAPDSSPKAAGASNWWLALMSVGVCLGTGAALALVAILA